jgi:hypothetical protein
MGMEFGKAKFVPFSEWIVKYEHGFKWGIAEL